MGSLLIVAWPNSDSVMASLFETRYVRMEEEVEATVLTLLQADTLLPKSTATPASL